MLLQQPEDSDRDDDADPRLRPESQWACVELATELIEPPCVFSNNDLAVMLDIVLRQLQDTDLTGSPSATAMEDAVARLELVREVVLSDWFIRVKHRAEDVAAIAEAVVANLPEDSSNPQYAAISCLAREIVRATKE